MADACEHEDFACNVDVNRLTKVEGGPVAGYSADVTIRCAGCGEAFVFIGPATGLSQREPRVSADATEIHLPVRPRSAPETFGFDLPGFNVAMHAAENRSN